MALGRREFLARVHSSRDLIMAVILAVAACSAAQAPAVGGKPLFGYLAALLAVSAGTLAIPAAISAVMKISATTLKRTGVAALLASRSLLGSLRRTSILVGALATDADDQPQQQGSHAVLEFARHLRDHGHRHSGKRRR